MRSLYRHVLRPLRGPSHGLPLAIFLVAAAIWVCGDAPCRGGGHAPLPAATIREVAFIDGALPEADLLRRLVPSHVEAITLDPSRDGIDQMAAHLASRGGLTAIHVLSHGREGAVRLGASWLDASTLPARAASVAAIGRALAPGGDLYLYGCRIGAGAEGRRFLETMARLADADVAGSVNSTAAPPSGGDWHLETTVGRVRLSTLSRAGTFDAYGHALATLSTGDLVVLGWSALTDTITLAALADIPSGTTVKFADKGWDGFAFTTSSTGDGVVTWTTSGTIVAGTVLQLFLGGSDETTTLSNITAGADLSGDLSVTTYTASDPMPLSGDQVFVYQDSDGNPYFLFGLNNSSGTVDGTNWNTSIGATLRDSLLPSGSGSQNALTNGVDAVGLAGSASQQDNVQYVGSTTTADKATWLARIVTSANWSGDNTGTLTSSVGTSGGSSVSVSSNTAPTLVLDGGTLSYTENASATQVSSAATVGDGEDNWNGGTLVAQISVNASASDVLAIGTATGLTVSGTSLLHGATTVATVSVSGGSVTGSTPLTATFNANATGAHVQNLVRALTFASTSEAPSTSTRTVAVTLTDDAVASTNATRTVSVTAINDDPVATVPGSISVIEDIATALTGISFSDVDAASGSVTVTLGVGSGTLAATSGGGVTASGSGSTSLVLTGSVANINAFIAGSNVSFTTASSATAGATLTSAIDDGGNTGSGGARTDSDVTTLTVTARNDAPTITAPGSIAATEDTATALTGISVSDVDAGGASVTHTWSVGSGVLSAVSGSGVTVSGSGTSTLSMTGSVASVNAFIAAGNVSFTTDSHAASNVTLTVGVDDGGNTGVDPGASGTSSSEAASTTITLVVSAVNDPPAATLPASITVGEDVATALTGISVSDVDAGSSSVALTLAATSGTLAAASSGGVTVSGSGTGTLGLTGSIANLNAYVAAGNVTFTTASSETTSVSLSVSLNDNGNSGSGGAQSAGGVVLLNVTAINDPPAIGAPSSIVVTEDVATALTGISFADADAGSTTVTATFGVASGTLSAASSGGVVVAGSGTSTLSLQGSIVSLNAFIAGSSVTFTTASDATTSVALNLAIDDGGHAGADPGLTGTGSSEAAAASLTLTVAAVNDAPSVVAPGTVAVAEDLASAITGLSFADVDAAAGTVVVTLTAGSGTLAASAGGGVAVGGSGTGALTLTGTVSNINTFVGAGGVTFTTASNATAPVTLDVAIDDGANVGSGGAQTAMGATTLLVAAANDAPTGVGLSSAALQQSAGVNAAVGTLTAVDVDAGETFVFSLPADGSYPDNVSFTIAGAMLRAPNAATLAARTYTLLVRATDSGAASVDQVLAVTVVDDVAPAIAVSGPSVSSTTAGPVTYTVTYEGADTVALDAGHITLAATGTAAGTVSMGGSGSSRTITIASISGAGTLTIAITAGTASDAAGNQAPASAAVTGFSVAQPIGLVSVYPTSGLASGNIAVSVGGAGFDTLTAPAIRFGSADATSVKVVSSTSIRAVTPALPAGFAVDVTLYDGATMVSSLASAFRPLDRPASPVHDTDGDAMPDAWELVNVLDALSAADALFDSDGDGRANLAEYASGTHPQGHETTYFGEGVTRAPMRTWLSLFNPTDARQTVQLDYLRDDSLSFSEIIELAPYGRTSFDVGAVPTFESLSFGVRVESAEPIVAENVVIWGDSSYGAHAEAAHEGSASWYFAEGATHGPFDLFYLIANPGTQAATVRVQFLRPAPHAPIERAYFVEAGSRLTVWVDTVAPELESTDVSAIITADLGVAIVVERAMYASTERWWSAGHRSAGAPQPSTSWFMAEGFTGFTFDTYLLLANPGDGPALVTVDYLGDEGLLATRTYPVDPRSRVTVHVDDEAPALAAASMSLAVTGDVPIVAERVLWWSSAPGEAWNEAHASNAFTSGAVRWGVADGVSGGAERASTYLLVANIAGTAQTVNVTVFLDDGTSSVRSFALPASSRLTVDVDAWFPAARDRRFSAIVEGQGTLVVERALYWDADGVHWAAGVSAPGTRLP